MRNRVQPDAKLDEIVNGYPKVSGQQPYLSNEGHAALTKALDFLKEFNDEFVAIERIVLGLLLKEKVAGMMKELGFAKKELIAAIKNKRRSSVTDQNAEAKYQLQQIFKTLMN